MKKQDLFAYYWGKEYLVLYFYPKDNTPWCTLEAKDFSCLRQEFLDLGVSILGCSKDTEDSHNNFLEKHNLNLTLISDEDLSLHKLFGVWWEKKNYGKTYVWVIRSTFLLNAEWEIIKERRNVRATWHAERVLKYLQSLDLLK